MKKQLLVGIALGVGAVSIAQTTVPFVAPKLPAAIANKAVLYKDNQQLGTVNDSFEGVVGKLKNAPAPSQKAYTTTTIGTSEYQLQSNASICNRIVLNSDGTISATWTMALTASPWADRGTGYNYYNGTAWGAAPTARIESTRCGWANVAVGANGAEYVISHEALTTPGTPNLLFSSRAAKGTGAWTTGGTGIADTWPRMVVGGANGTTLHVIAQSSGATTPVTPYRGQDGALCYSRSLDGGATWDKIRTIIPALDSSNYLGFGGDSYAIDVKGDTVVIVVGGFKVDVAMVKSIDNGNTWTKTIIKQFPIPLFDEPTMLSDIDSDGIADTLDTNDAAVGVILDNQGKAHVFYGAMRMLNDDVSDNAVSYFPGTDGLMYWNENMGATPPKMIAAALDLNNDQTLNVADWGTYQTSLTSHPNAGIDAQGRIYLAYSSIFEGAAENGSPADGKSYRHTFVLRSSDGGATWCGPLDITDPGELIGLQEGVYGAIAKDVDGFVHVLQQVDAAPGHGIGTTNPDASTNIGSVNFDYVKIPVTDFDGLPCYAEIGVGINEIQKDIATINVYPNPANDIVNVTLTSSQKAIAVVSVYNAIGQKVTTINNPIVAGTPSVLTINTSNYQAGVYFVAVNVNGKVVSQKLIVE